LSFNPFAANVLVVTNEGDVTGSGCSASYRQNLEKPCFRKTTKFATKGVKSIVRNHVRKLEI